jgi:hypothetical protein
LTISLSDGSDGGLSAATRLPQARRRYGRPQAAPNMAVNDETSRDV